MLLQIGDRGKRTVDRLQHFAFWTEEDFIETRVFANGKRPLVSKRIKRKVLGDHWQGTPLFGGIRIPVEAAPRKFGGFAWVSGAQDID